MHPSDHIPVLPAMPKPVIRRRRRSYRPWMVAIGVATAAALGVMVVAVKARYRTMADESFRRAEELFASGAFTKAQQEFDFFRNEYASDSRTQRAKLAAELSKVAQSIDDELAEANRVTESLDKFASDNRDSRSAASVKERWPVILTMAERAARSRLEKASRSLAAAELESGDTWLRWLHDQQKAQAEGSESLALADLDRLSAKARDAIAAEGRRRSFMDAADRALADGTTAQFADAFRAYDQWRAGPPAIDPTIAATHERLRQALRAGLRFDMPPKSGETTDSVPVLPVEAYTRLSTRTQHKTVTISNNRPVFARAKDLCFALEPATGVVRWVLRVGYDAPLPEGVAASGRQLVVVPWFSGAEPMISLCDAATGESIWSWTSPDLLAGSPVVTRDSIFAATVGGSIWQLDLKNGTPRGVAELPEPLDSPLTPREDGRGFCVVGARQAVYLFDTSGEQPQCSDLVLFGRRPDTAHCQVMWVPPYVVIFENDLMNRCYVRVLFQESGGLRQIRQLEAPLDGRVWQQPVMDGADIFVMTDRFKIHCFGLDPGDSAINLYQAATALKPPPAVHQPTRPQLARVTELPFVAVSDAIYGYRADRSQGLLREVWTRALPHPEARVVQPIQAVQHLVVAGFQDSSDDGILVQCFDSRQGEPVWETRLASAARDVAVVGSDTTDYRIVARTEVSGKFVVTQDQTSGEWKSHRLNQPATNSPVRFTDDGGELVFVSEGGTRLLRYQWREPGTIAAIAQSPPITSDLTLFRGEYAVSERSMKFQSGRWSFFVTADRSIEMRDLMHEKNDIHGVRIPAATPADQPWRWSPLVVKNNEWIDTEHNDVLGAVIAAHPSGIVCRAQVRHTDGIPHLVVTECRTDLPPLAAAPILWGGLLCVSTEGRCMLLDSTTLRTMSDWQATEPVRDAVGRELAYILVGRSGVQVLIIRDRRLDGGSRFELGGGRICELGDGDWKLAFIKQGPYMELVAYSSLGEIVKPDPFCTSKLWTYRAPAPLAVPPQWVDGKLVLATIDGGLFFVPDPGKATREGEK